MGLRAEKTFFFFGFRETGVAGSRLLEQGRDKFSSQLRPGLFGYLRHRFL